MNLRNLIRRRRDLSGALLTTVVMQVALIPSGVLCARILGPRDLGYLALFQLFPVILRQVGGMGLPTAITYFTAKDPSNSGTLMRGLRSIIGQQVAVLFAVHACIILFVLSSRPNSVRWAGLMSLLVVPAGLAYQYGLAILQGQQRFRAFNALRAAVPIVYSLGVITAFLGGFGSLTVIMFFYVSTLSLLGISSLVTAFARLPRAITNSRIGFASPVVRFGFKSLISTISPIETFRLDQAIVGLLISPFGLGIYVVGLAFTTFPKMIAQSIGYIAYPRVAAVSADRAHQLMWRYFFLSVAVCVAVVGALVLLVPILIPVFFGPGFEQSIGVAKILLLATLFAGARRTLAEGAKGAGDPVAGTVAEVVSWFALVAAVLLSGQETVFNVANSLLVSSVLGLIALLFIVHFRRGLGLRKSAPSKNAFDPIARVDSSDPAVPVDPQGFDGTRRTGRRVGEPSDL